MTLHFAYGSNMSRPLMEMRCPAAAVVGTGSLAGWRFIINPDGVGSIARHPGAQVLVVHHSDFDVLIPSHSRIGKLSGGTMISMLLGTPG
jgi:hypothetical protein